MTICIPIKELKNTAAFAKTVEEASEPVIVTRNGYETFAVMTVEKLDALKQEAARVRLYRDIDEAEDDFASGRVVDGHESQRAARERYGL